MTLKVSHNNTPAYDYVSEDGAMTNPIVRSITIDKTGGEVTSDSIQVYLVATDEGEGDIGGYRDIVVSPSTAQAGLTWEISLDNISFGPSAEPADMDVESADDIVSVYVRVKGDNEPSSVLVTNNYAGEIKTHAVERPPVI